MTSLDSTAPYSTDDLQKLSMMVNKLKGPYTPRIS